LIGLRNKTQVKNRYAPLHRYTATRTPILAVNWTGRILREDKRGAISEDAENILTRLGIDDSQWLEMTSKFEQCFATFAGNEQRLRSACETLNYQRPPGLSRYKATFR